MTVAFRSAPTPGGETDLLVRFVDSRLAALDGGEPPGADLSRRQGFGGKPEETLLAGEEHGRSVLFVGVGDPQQITADLLRRIGAAVARAANRCASVAVVLAGIGSDSIDEARAAQLIGEGIALRSYSFDRFRQQSGATSLEVVEFVGSVGDEIDILLDRAAAVGEAVTLCRDLVNTPAGDLSPRDFATTAIQVASAAGLEIEVYDEARIAEEKMGGLLGVAAGSVEPPRFVKLTYVPEGAEGEVATVALVGKGITFDSGGLSLKTGTGMMTMKTDMSGAAAVLATLSICARLAVKVRVIGYMPLTENMPSGSATKPGDVLTIRDGQTIEVLNTDAEGRLILADALSLAADAKPDAIIDLATLTGACVVALGSNIAGVLGNDDGLIGQVLAAGREAGESLWPLPLPLGYHHHIESEIADMKNIGVTGQAGTISAALLLERFVGEVPWVHLDIAGPARSEEDRGLVRKGATGFGVRTLVRLLERYEPRGGQVHGQAEGLTVLT